MPRQKVGRKGLLLMCDEFWGLVNHRIKIPTKDFLNFYNCKTESQSPMRCLYCFYSGPLWSIEKYFYSIHTLLGSRCTATNKFLILPAIPHVWVDTITSEISQDKCPHLQEVCSYHGENANLLLPTGLSTFHDDSTHQIATDISCKSTAPQNCQFSAPAVSNQCPDVQ